MLEETKGGSLTLKEQSEAVDTMMKKCIGEEKWCQIVTDAKSALDESMGGALSAFDRAFRLETAHVNRCSIQEMLLQEINPQFKADVKLPMKDRLPNIHGMAINLQRRAIDYNDILDGTVFKDDKLDSSVQAYATDVAVASIQLIDLLGPPAVDEFLKKLEVSNTDIHLRVPKIEVSVKRGLRITKL